jgi:hypothetical protein
MNKVYFDKTKNIFFVDELENFYYFKSFNTKTNELSKQIISWTHGIDMDKYPNHIRMYDVEIENIKYLFLMRNQDNKFILESEDPIILESLSVEHNLFLVGDRI